MVINAGATSSDRSRRIKDFNDNVLRYSAHEGLKTFALQQIRKATYACSHLTDPSEPDALHDFRVAVRRLRTWIRVFKHYHNVDRKTIKRLGKLTDSTNRLRDLEVCRNWLDASGSEIVISPDGKQVLEILREKLNKDYEQELAAINTHMAADWEKLLVSLDKHLASGIDTDKTEDRLPNVAGKKILVICKSVDDQLALIHTIEDRGAIHKLRIYFKRLRYLLEPFRFQKPAIKEIIKSLKNIQDLLGDFRDAYVSSGLLATYQDKRINNSDNGRRDSENRANIIDNLGKHVRNMETERFERFRKLYVNGDFQQIIARIRMYGEELKSF